MKELSAEVYWKLCEELSVDDASHLIIGILPDEIEAMAQSGSELTPSSKRKYETSLRAIRTALISATETEKIKTAICYHPSNYHGGPLEYDIYETKINVDVLKSWLLSKNIKPAFFFDNNNDEPDYLDKNNPYYAPKLATAIKAWKAITSDLSRLKNKSPKQALEKWLKENAKEFDLLDENGNHIKQTIEDICKIANWQTKGGATKTPEIEDTIKNPTKIKNWETQDKKEEDVDCDIPF